ncbi:MAG: CapA family protein [Firmicutes bacterium]|nr:CapA family protein [Bacillota bacterium]
MKRHFVLAGILLLFVLVFWGLIPGEMEPTRPAAGEIKGVPSPPEIISTITLASAGDIMAHMPQVNAALDRETGEYDFTACFAPVRPLFLPADIALANLETTLAGAHLSYSGYPRFNTPPELATALRWAGFDLLSTANNHSLDRGEEGVLQTLDHLAANDLVAVGTYRDDEEREKITMLRVRGQRLAFLAYTYGTNGIPFPAGKEYLVKLIAEEEIERDIAQARELGADWIIALPHFGNEYQRTPSAQQRELVDFFLSRGVDIVLGNHAHVLQPIEMVPGEEGERLVAYSQGNFISNQRDRYRDSGIILTLTLEKNLTWGEKRLKRVAYTPTWVHKYREEGRIKYRILPVKRALRNYEAHLDPHLTEHDYRRLQEVWKETVEWVDPDGVLQLQDLDEEKIGGQG